MPFDLFLLTSREDPYPLVVIEAAYNKVPALCFESSGGIPEFLNSANGWVIDGFSEDKMSEKIIELSKHPKEVEIAGENAYSRAKEWHSNEQTTIIEFNKILENSKKIHNGNQVS
jgi:glycosyltransferase involved in cell wall biosynthesis